MHDSTLSDRELLVATRQGDGEAFGAFYSRRRGVVLAFLHRRVGSAEVAADLLAETFAAALSVALDTDRDLPAEPVAWLMTVARNKLRDGLRRGRVEQAARLRLGMQRLSLDDEDLQRIDELAGATDVVAELAAALPPEQLAAVQARIVEERDYSDIAETLRCSEAVARQRVSRALRSLRAAMEGLR